MDVDSYRYPGPASSCWIGISPEVAVRLQRLAFERVTDLMY
jgi:hypothetical protein